jgi:hypothetical protein
MELVTSQESRIYPALFCSAAIHRGAVPQSVTRFLNHPSLIFHTTSAAVFILRLQHGVVSVRKYGVQVCENQGMRGFRA